MAIENGYAIIVTHAGHTISGVTSNSMEVSQNMIDVTTKDDSRWKKFIPGDREANMTVEGNYSEDHQYGLEYLSEAIIDGDATVTVVFGKSGGTTWTASAYVESVSFSAPNDDAATWSCTLKIDGAVEVS